MTALRARLGQVQLAVMLLTRLPAGRLPSTPAPSIAQAAWAFPLAGIGPGLIAMAIVIAGLWVGMAPMIIAGLAIAAQVLVTGALHEDGLADLADGFWGGRNPERRLEIMRDSRLGSYGAVALVVSIGLRWQALAAVAGSAELSLTNGGLWVPLGVAMASRTAPVMLMTLLPPARTDGMGRAATGPHRTQLIVAGVIGIGPIALLPGGIIAAGLAILGVMALAAIARAKIGGQTGDVLGTAQQAAEIIMLITLATALMR